MKRLLGIVLACACARGDADGTRTASLSIALSAGDVPLTVRVTNVRRLTEHGGLQPRFTPDGRRVAFSSDRFEAIQLVSAAGGDARSLVQAPGSGYRFAWSADSRQVAYHVRAEEGGGELRVLDTFTGETRTEHSFGPDARLPMPLWRDEKLLFVDEERLVSPGGAVVADGLPHPGMVRLSRATGRFVVGGDDGVFTTAPDGSDARMLFPGERYFDPEVSADGRLVLVRDLGAGPSGLVAADLENGSTWIVGDFDRGCVLPESGMLVVETNADDGYDLLEGDLWAVRPDGTGAARLAGPWTVAHKVDCHPSEDRVVFQDEADGSIWTAELAVEDAR